MKLSKTQIITKIHLVISVLVVIPVAFMYGFQLKSPFKLQAGTIDEHSFFKAVMGLYLGFCVLWLLGIFKTNYLKVALISNTIFMLGLGLGRLLSWFIDGVPNYGYQFGTFAELVLGFYGLWVLINCRRFNN
jgi:hypothetical protein